MKVAGVTFNNVEKDGGKNRQEILGGFLKNGINIITADLIYTTYKNEFAVKVREHSTKQVIGWIPKDELPGLKDKKTKQMTGFITNYGVCSVRLMPQEKPTSRQYAYMKHICHEREIPMPAYDKRAYTKMFAQMTENEK